MSNLQTTKKQKPYSKKLDLSGLFELAQSQPADSESSVDFSQFIPIEVLHCRPEQVRRYFDPQKMEQLVHSIKVHGILENLLVRPFPGRDGEYELIAGERRYRAALAAELSEVPVRILHLNDLQVRQIALIENLQREELNPVEETQGILQLLSLQLEMEVSAVTSLLYKLQNAHTRKLNHSAMVQEQLSVVEKLFSQLGQGNWQSFVKNRLPLLKLPEEILVALETGKLAYTKAMALKTVREPKLRNQLLSETIEQNLSLAQIRQRIKSVTSNSQKTPPPLKTQMSKTYQRLQKASLWDNPKKHQALEKLLAQMEALLDEEE
jgi:ParB family chromosome partitioning protein